MIRFGTKRNISYFVYVYFSDIGAYQIVFCQKHATCSGNLLILIYFSLIIKDTITTRAIFERNALKRVAKYTDEANKTPTSRANDMHKKEKRTKYSHVKLRKT